MIQCQKERLLLRKGLCCSNVLGAVCCETDYTFLLNISASGVNMMQFYKN